MRNFTQALTIAVSITLKLFPVAQAAGPLDQTKPQASRSTYTTDVLVYAGDSAAYGDPEALTSIAESRGMTTRSVTSDQLNQMSLDDLSKFGVIAWPGGYAGQMSKSLTAQARENIRRAVQERGVGFVGFCAGAFIAVSPDTHSGVSAVTGAELDYYHLENEGTDESMVGVQFADGTKRDLLWWGGPFLPEWKDGVIARYNDTHQPAIAQTWSGNGLVILSGPHPEAPEDWRTKLGLNDSDGLDQEYAGQMLQAAAKQTPLMSQ